jgi:putative SOS response-associated peptidase YedK
MCGRFSLTTTEATLNERFRLAGAPEPYVSRYNCAPTQNLAVIVNEEIRRLRYFRWGLIPHWAKDAKIGAKLINARAETIDEKPSFKNAFKQRRCLVPADGFYEWKTENGKQPFRILLKNKEVFAMAGLWESWKSPEGSVVHSFTIITTAANELMKAVHERMPVILNTEDEEGWLKSSDSNKISLLKPFSAAKMEMYPVSKAGELAPK